jgi:hypothetical protein
MSGGGELYTSSEALAVLFLCMNSLREINRLKSNVPLGVLIPS